MKFVAKSDVGKRRKNNEDSFFAKIYNENVALFIVADGLGGYASGEVASSIITETISNYVEENINILTTKSDEQIINKIRRIVLEANKKIYNLEKTDIKYDNMGSTIVLVLKVKDSLYYTSIGDTRLYHIDSNFKKIQQITVDDTYVNELIKTNIINEEEAKVHPQKHMLTKAVGITKELEFEVEKLNISDGYLMLCSDGLTNMLEDKEILKIIKDNDFESLAETLVYESNENGGYDNITVIVIKGE